MTYSIVEQGKLLRRWTYSAQSFFTRKINHIHINPVNGYGRHQAELLSVSDKIRSSPIEVFRLKSHEIYDYYCQTYVSLLANIWNVEW